MQIHDNDLTGPSPNEHGATGGLELWGRNIDVRRNEIKLYPTEGIQANSTYNLTILDNNRTLNNNTHPQGQTGGILVWTQGHGIGCNPTPRDTDNVEIRGNTSTGNAYGILLAGSLEGRNVVKNITITDNTLQPNTRAAVGLETIVTLSGYNIQAGTTQVTSDPEPRALEIAPRCSAPGSVSKVFTFSVADVNMPANIRYIEGVFSDPGDDETGAPGPGAPACHFLYFHNVPDDPPLNNKLFLDDATQFYTWPWSSYLGPGGTDLNNGFCKIRTSLSQSTTEQKILTLTLDVEFLSPLPPKKHMYLVVADNDGQSSHGGLWKYSGWWSTQ